MKNIGFTNYSRIINGYLGFEKNTRVWDVYYCYVTKLGFNKFT